MKTTLKTLLVALACCASAMLIAGPGAEVVSGLSASPAGNAGGAAVTKKADSEAVNLLAGLLPTTHGSKETTPDDPNRTFAAWTDGDKSAFAYKECTVFNNYFEAIYDLGDNYKIDRLLFTGYTYNKPPFDYVEISLDGENFELIGSFPAGSDVDYTPEATVVGRYLRLRWDAKTTYTSYYITELEAFGTKFEGTIHPYPKFELPEASRLIDVNAKGTIEFTYEMGDDFEDDNFGVSASSSDENVVKIEDVVLDRANHKVIVSLASFENPGNAEITVSMTNGLFVRNKKETVTVWYSDYPDVLAGKAATSFVENGTPKEDVDLSLFTDGDFSTGYNGYNVNDEITFDMGSNYQAKKLIWYEVTPQKVEFSTDGNEWLECEEFAGLSGVNELILKAPFVFRYIRFTVGATWAYFNANEFQVYAKAYDGIVHTHPRFTLENKYLVKNGDETKISFKYTMDDEEYAENFAFTAKSLNEELFTVTNVEHRKLEKKINITVKAEDVFAKGMISVKAVNGEYTCERETAVEIWDTSFPNIVSQKPCSLTANVTYFNPEPECKVITDGNLETYTDGQNWVFSTYYLYTTFELDGIYDIRKIAWTGSLNHLFEIETSYDGEEFTRFEGFDESTLTASDDNYIFGDNFPKAKFIRLSWSNWEQYGSFKINELEIYGKLHEGVVNWHPIFKLPYKFNANAGKENVLVYSFDMGEEEYTDTFSASATTDSELFAVKGVEVDKENHKAYITIEAGEEHGSAPISVTMTNGDFSKTRLGLVEIFNTDVQNILLGLGGAETDGDFTTKPEESVGTKVYDMTTYFDISRISWAGSLIGMAVSENGSDFTDLTIPTEQDYLELETPIVARYIRFATYDDVYELQAFGKLHSGTIATYTNTPVALEGFDVDIIAEGTPVADFSSTDMDGANWLYYSASFNEVGGLPADGLVKSADVVLYKFADYAGNNALRVTNDPAKLVVKDSERQESKGVRILGTSANGTGNVKIIVHFIDGTSKEQTVDIADWGATTSAPALENLGRTNRSSNEYINRGFNISYIDIKFDASATVESLEFVRNNNAAPYIFAATLIGTPAEPIIIDELNAPVISLASGRYWEPQVASITADKDDDVIYYTLDGTRPTKESAVYTEPLNITETCVLNAVVFRGVARSDFAEAEYELPTVVRIEDLDGFAQVEDSYRGVTAFEMAVTYQFNDCAYVKAGDKYGHVFVGRTQLVNGNIIPEGTVFEKYTDENGKLVLNLIGTLDAKEGAPIDPEATAISSITPANEDKYIHLIGVNFDAKNQIAIELGEYGVNVLNKFNVQMPTYNKACDIIAIVGEDSEGVVIFLIEFRESTGVETINSDEAVESVYNLKGMKFDNDVKNAESGLYIINGKKTYLKK